MRRSLSMHSIVISLTAALIAANALAQTPPDAGALQQQIERERAAVPLPKKLEPVKRAAPAVMKPVSDMLISVKKFNFAGNTLIAADQLAPVVRPYLNRPLDFNELQAAAAAVANAFREAGWVVRAYLPAQDIKDGIVTLQVIEAIFGGTQLEGKAKRVSEKQILRRVEAQQTKGRLLNADALDRAMLLADDLPGVGVAGALSQGKEDGETDLILKLNDEALMNGDANLDNTGSRSTGRERFAANINLSSPFKLGDLLNSSLIHTQGSNYARLGYSVPVGAKGLRIGASASHLGYKLISSDFAGLGGKGTSNSAGIEASYPLIRSRLKNLYYSLNADHKSFDNEFSGATTSQYRLNNLSVGLNGNLFDNLGGGGSNAASLAVVTGRRINRIGTTDQRYSKLRYSFSRQQVISQQVSLLATLSGQESRDNLDSSERFYLGGASGVRAYPSSEASGSSGTLANIELRWRLPHDFSVSGFYDYGQVRNKDGSLSYSLEGAGLAAAWQSSFGLNLKASWARRIGDNPNPVITGNDQDGSLVDNRFWLTANQSF